MSVGFQLTVALALILIMAALLKISYELERIVAVLELAYKNGWHKS